MLCVHVYIDNFELVYTTCNLLRASRTSCTLLTKKLTSSGVFVEQLAMYCVHVLAPKGFLSFAGQESRVHVNGLRGLGVDRVEHRERQGRSNQWGFPSGRIAAVPVRVRYRSADTAVVDIPTGIGSGISYRSFYCYCYTCKPV